MSTHAFGHFKPSVLSRTLIALSQSRSTSWLGRRLALSIRKIHLLFFPRKIDYTIDGINYRFHLDDNVGERKFLFMPQFFDNFERDLIKKKLSSKDTFIDIGANAGIYTLSAAKQVGPDGIVISIEPNPVMLNRLKFNIDANFIDTNIYIEEVAISRSEGTFPLYLDPDNLGGSSLSPRNSHEHINIPCVTLESIIKKHSITHIRILKIDIEGMEDQALAPYFQSVDPALYPDYLIMEDSSKAWSIDLLELLHSKGYSIINKTRMNLVLNRHHKNTRSS